MGIGSNAKSPLKINKNNNNNNNLILNTLLSIFF